MMILRILFNKTMEVSISASVIVLIILIIRHYGVKILNPRIVYYLWFLFVLKLVFPFFISSPFSIENITDSYIYQNMMGGTRIAASQLVKVQNSMGMYENKSEIKKEVKEYKNGQPIEKLNSITDSTMVGEIRYISAVNWISDGISALWFSGFIILISRRIYGNIKFKRFFIKHNYCEDEEITTLFAQCKKQMGIGKDIRLLMSGSVIPILYGMIKPVILLPYDCKELFTFEELRYIMMHELEHYKKKDVVLYWILDILKVIHWFNPLIHFAIRKMKDDCEALCDLRVIDRLEKEEGINYGRLLIKQAELNLISFNQSSLSAGLFCGQSQLKLRIKRIMAFQLKRPKRVQCIIGGCIFILMVFILIPVGEMYDIQKKFMEQRPVLYVFWMDENVELNDMKTIESLTAQILGESSEDKEVKLLIKNKEELPLIPSKYPLKLEEKWPLYMLWFEKKLEVDMKGIRKEIERAAPKQGKIYIMVQCNFPFSKYFSATIARQVLMDLESMKNLDRANLY